MKRTFTLFLLPATTCIAAVIALLTCTNPGKSLPAMMVANSNPLSHEIKPVTAGNPSDNPMAPDVLSRIYSDIAQRKYHTPVLDLHNQYHRLWLINYLARTG